MRKKVRVKVREVMMKNKSFINFKEKTCNLDPLLYVFFYIFGIFFHKVNGHKITRGRKSVYH